jgi:hypothetical protein
MNRAICRIAIALLPALLAACATATPYQPLRGGEGYAEQKLESNRYRISFAGNSATPQQQVDDYLLYRAAEVTLAGGYDYFVLTGKSSEGQQGQSGGVSLGFGGFSIGSGGGVGVGVGTSTGGGTAYQATAEIVMFKGRKPDDNPRAFDARAVKENLQAQIKSPQP